MRLTLVLALLCFTLSACSTKHDFSAVNHSNFSQVGQTGGPSTNAITSLSHSTNAITHAILGKYADNEAQLVAHLRERGVYIVRVGDTISILLPSDLYFDPSDDLLRHDHYPNLDLIARLLRHYRTAAVKVAVGMDNVDSPERSKFLGKLQAQRISAYLWRQGVSAWRLYPLSYGDQNLLASNNTVFGSQKNRVIEITFNPHIKPSDCCSKIDHFVAKKQIWQYWGYPY